MGKEEGNSQQNPDGDSTIRSRFKRAKRASQNEPYRRVTENLALNRIGREASLRTPFEQASMFINTNKPVWGLQSRIAVLTQPDTRRVPQTLQSAYRDILNTLVDLQNLLSLLPDDQGDDPLGVYRIELENEAKKLIQILDDSHHLGQAGVLQNLNFPEGILNKDGSQGAALIQLASETLASLRQMLNLPTRELNHVNLETYVARQTNKMSRIEQLFINAPDEVPPSWSGMVTYTLGLTKFALQTDDIWPDLDVLRGQMSLLLTLFPHSVDQALLAEWQTLNPWDSTNLSTKELKDFKNGLIKNFEKIVDGLLQRFSGQINEQSFRLDQTRGELKKNPALVEWYIHTIDIQAHVANTLLELIPIIRLKKERIQYLVTLVEDLSKLRTFVSIFLPKN